MKNKLFTNDWVWSSSNDERGYDFLKFFGVFWWILVFMGLCIFVRITHAIATTDVYGMSVFTCIKFYLITLIFLVPGILGAFWIFRK